MVLLVALSFMVGLLFWQGRGEQRLINAALSEANEDLARMTVLRLLWQEGLRRMKKEGSFPSPLMLKLDTTPSLKATLTISAEENRLDLNQAGETALLSLFLDHGLPEEEAQVLVESLLDWRDTDNLHRLNGAEKDYYLPRGYIPRNGPFQSLAEVALVRGLGPYRFWFNPGIYRWVTIYGGTKVPALEPSSENLLRLHAGKVYRLELLIRQGQKSLRYLEIFRYKGGGKRARLFSFTW